MTVLSYSNARKDFRKLIDKVNDDSDTVTITTNERNAVLMSAKHLAQSISEAEKSNTVEVDIDSYE